MKYRNLAIFTIFFSLLAVQTLMKNHFSFECMNFFWAKFHKNKKQLPPSFNHMGIARHCHCELVQRFHCSQKKEEDVSTSIHLSKRVSYSQKTSTLLTKSSYKLSYSHNNIAKHRLLCNTPLFPNGNTTTYAST